MGRVILIRGGGGYNKVIGSQCSRFPGKLWHHIIKSVYLRTWSLFLLRIITEQTHLK